MKIVKPSTVCAFYLLGQKDALQGQPSRSHQVPGWAEAQYVDGYGEYDGYRGYREGTR